jgi:hypothetical protein
MSLDVDASVNILKAEIKLSILYKYIDFHLRSLEGNINNLQVVRLSSVLPSDLWSISLVTFSS